MGDSQMTQYTNKPDYLALVFLPSCASIVKKKSFALCILVYHDNDTRETKKKDVCQVQNLVESLLDIHHGCESRAAFRAHLMPAPWALDCHGHAARKICLAGAQYAIGVGHGLVESAGQVVVAAASAALNEHLAGWLTVVLVMLQGGLTAERLDGCFRVREGRSMTQRRALNSCGRSEAPLAPLLVF